MTKTCTKCKKTKNITDFYRKNRKNRKIKIGHASRCKKCDDIVKKDWVKRNPEKKRAYERKRNRGDSKKKADLARSRRYCKELAPQYIRQLIRISSTNLKTKDISDEFVEAYRLNLKLKRALGLTPKLRSST